MRVIMSFPFRNQILLTLHGCGQIVMVSKGILRFCAALKNSAHVQALVAGLIQLIELEPWVVPMSRCGSKGERRG